MHSERLFMFFISPALAVVVETTAMVAAGTATIGGFAGTAVAAGGAVTTIDIEMETATTLRTITVGRITHALNICIAEEDKSIVTDLRRLIIWY